MKFLLDTNICVFLIRNQFERIHDHVRSHQVGEIGVSSITEAELRFGADKSSDPGKNHAALERLFLTLPVLAFDSGCAREYGRIRATLEKTGAPIGPLDTLIAAHALSEGMTVVTNNTREFKRFRACGSWIGRKTNPPQTVRHGCGFLPAHPTAFLVPGSSSNPVQRKGKGNKVSRLRRGFHDKVNHSWTLIWPGQYAPASGLSIGEETRIAKRLLVWGGSRLCKPVAARRHNVFPYCQDALSRWCCEIGFRHRLPNRPAGSHILSPPPLRWEHFFHQWFQPIVSSPPQAARPLFHPFWKQPIHTLRMNPCGIRSLRSSPVTPNTLRPIRKSPKTLA